MAAFTTPIGDFADIIQDRTHLFSGRGWVFHKIENWLRDPNGKRVFLLSGGPGTGKTAVAARVAQASLGQVQLDGCPSLQSGFLTYLHFCQAGRDSTLSPLAFVQSLSQALANRVPGFREALERQGSQQIIINSTASAGSAAPGSTVVGSQNQIKIEIRSGDARPMFDVAVRQPLKAVAATPPALEPIVVLVDSLDEALSFNGETNIARLLQVVNDFPPEVRFILTSRSNNQRVTELVGPPALDLIADAPPAENEVATYAQTRLTPVAEPLRTDLAKRISTESAGNFLYAYHVLNDLLSRPLSSTMPIELPDGLEGVYRTFLERQFTTSSDQWQKEVRPLLGTIVVARGDGLTRSQLAGITEIADERVDDLLRVLSEYLVGGAEAAEPLRIYHQSFREFLLDDQKYAIYPAARHAAAATFFLKKYGRTLSKNPDDYALRHTPEHLAEAAQGLEAKRDELVTSLIELASNKGYQDRCESRWHDIPMINEHMVSAVASVALSSSDAMLPLLARAGLEYATFRERFLQGTSVIALAKSGDAANAEGRLPLFSGLDRDWQTAASLIIAWLAIKPNAARAADIVTRIANAPHDEPTLQLLLERVQLALTGLPAFAKAKPGPPRDLAIAAQLVKRISGQETDRELMVNLINDHGGDGELMREHGFTAIIDGPVLVNTALAQGPPATEFLDSYVDAHAGYNYVEYRNKSLWVVLHAVLFHHPDQDWVLARLERILSVALMSGGAEFCESAPLMAAVLLEKANGSTGRTVLDEYSKAAGELLAALQNVRGANDSWSLHRRRLLARLEANALIVDDAIAARGVFNEIDSLEHAGGQDSVLGGFAGFQAPAVARYADALLATQVAPDRIIDIAKKSVFIAHRIQDYRFCARMTARCQTLLRWHNTALTASDLEAVVARFANAPGDVEFAADHTIGDPYEFRDRDAPGKLPIEDAQRANTFDALADVFQRSVVAFVRLNPGVDLDTAMPNGTTVKVPDPGLAPALAIHLAARVLNEPALAGKKADLIRRLVPLAAANATAFDTVLSYLAIASEIEDSQDLKNLTIQLGPPTIKDSQRPAGSLVRNAAIPA
jgi:hypothetical protein